MSESSHVWWANHDNIVTLTAWMAEHGHDAREVAYAVEKTWKFGDLYEQAEADDDIGKGVTT